MGDVRVTYIAIEAEQGITALEAFNDCRRSSDPMPVETKVLAMSFGKWTLGAGRQASTPVTYSPKCTFIHELQRSCKDLTQTPHNKTQR